MILIPRISSFMAVSVGSVILGAFVWAACSPQSRNIEVTDGAGGPSTGGEGGGMGGDGTGGDSAVPVDCEEDDDCSGTSPLCGPDAVCVPCSDHAECEGVGASYCVPSGACGECLTDAQCANPTPICDELGSCSACTEHSQCESMACKESGACADEEEVVYALAQTGSSDTECGSFVEPCQSLTTATSKLTEERPYLVFIPTTSSFTTSVTLPAGLNATVVGNDVTLDPFSSEAGVVISGPGKVQLHGMHIIGLTDPDAAAVKCDGGAELTIEDSSFEGNTVGVAVAACSLDLQRSTVSMGDWAITSTCDAASCPGGNTYPFTVERTLLEGNAQVLHTNSDEVLFRNNILVDNGAPGYDRQIDFRGASATFTYNTLYRTYNGCSFVGLVICADTQVSSSNITLDSFPDGDCPDQVYYDCTLEGRRISYSLAETTWPGIGNSIADPLLADPENGDFTPLPGSPAIDQGEAALAPEVDFFGNPRGVGNGPDIGAIEVQ